MKKKICLFLLLFFAMLIAHAGSSVTTPRFKVGNGTFLMDGKPFVIKAAELHYPRIPRPYWEHRIQMCKALGMNTICLYVFWNLHEQQEGVFDFTGDKDVAAFCRLCQKNGMYVIVRPGPYVCAEWEMGGLPWWLLRKKDINLRHQDPYFMERVRTFEKEVGNRLAPLTIDNGGSIIMVQVENEYGSYATDKPYVSAIRDIVREAWESPSSGEVGSTKCSSEYVPRMGFPILFQCDWSSNFTLNALDDLLWTMNFGTGADILAQFQRVRQMRPDTPLMCSEFWSGWFDEWGVEHQKRPSDAMVQGIGTMLDNGISFSLYMTHGGTSFGHWAGSNSGFMPDCTSYDYDAPINEQGAPTQKYHQLRTLLQKYSDVKLPSVPKAKPIISIPDIRFTEMAPLFRAGNMPDVIHSATVQPMEQFGQGYGSILYSTTLPAMNGGILELRSLHDYAIVYIDGQEVARSYRGADGSGAGTLAININRQVPQGAQLQIFVEAMGRINYSQQINDPKGITSAVLLHTTDGKNQITYNLGQWDIHLYPVDMDYNDLSYCQVVVGNTQPAYYKSTFTLSRLGDTYLDLSTWGKGMVWVNGHCLGRFWQVGPQQTLYLPGCWLSKGQNEIVILDLVGPSDACVRGLTTPILDQLHREYIPSAGYVFDSSHHAGIKLPVVGNDAAPGAK